MPGSIQPLEAIMLTFIGGVAVSAVILLVAQLLSLKTIYERFFAPDDLPLVGEDGEGPAEKVDEKELGSTRSVLRFER